MKKKNIAWLLSAAIILTTAAAPVETMSVNAAEEFQAETNEAEDTVTDTATDTVEEVSEVPENEDVADAESNAGETITTGETASEDSQDNDTGDLELFEDSAEADNFETEELQADVEEGFSDGEAAVAGASESSEIVDSGNCGSDAAYKLYGDGRLVIEGSGSIVSNAFTEKTSIKYLEIGEGITSIGENAFEGCRDLRSFTLPQSLLTVEQGAFMGCSRLTGVVLPGNLTTLETSAFMGCNKLTSVVLPDSLTVLSDRVFDGCENLSSLTLSQSLTSIGEEAFFACRKLETIKLPDSVTDIGKGAFAYNPGLKSIEISPNVREIKESTFEWCSSLESIKFPESLNKIGNKAFYGCESLKKLEIPDVISEIGEYAFGACACLEEVNIPIDLQNIKYGTFDACSNLKSVCIQEGVKSIDTDAFRGCSSLKSVILLGMTTKIEDKVLGYLSDTEKNRDFIIIGQDHSTASKYASENGLAFHGINDPLTHYEKKDATCTEDGNTEYWHCDICDKNFDIKDNHFLVLDQYILSKTGHGLEYVPGGIAICLQSGNRDYYHCKKCGKNYTDMSAKTELTESDIVIPAPGHRIIYREARDANCISDGNKASYYCTGCGTYFVDKDGKQVAKDVVIPMNGKHSMTYYPARDANCANCGNRAYYHCSICSSDFLDKDGKQSANTSDIVIPVNGKHNLVYQKANNATCINAGNKEYYFCNNCFKYFQDKDGKQQISGESVTIPANGVHALEYHSKEEPNCIHGGKKAYYYCTGCYQYFLDQEGKQKVAEADLILPTEPQNHTMRYIEGYEATCTNEGRKGYYICDYCQQIFLDEKGTQRITEGRDLVIPKTESHVLELEKGYPAECLNPGMKDTYRCTSCGKHFLDKDGKEEIQQDSDVLIPELGHKFTDEQWVNHGSGKHTVSKGNPTPIFFTADYQQHFKCERCGFQDWGETRTYNMSVNTDQVTLKNGQSTTAIRVSDFANGDYLKSVTPKDTGLVTVSNVNKNGTFKLTAKNKNGSTWVTITLNSGVKTNILVTVRVTTQAITNLKSTVSVVKGKKVTLKPVLKPVTSKDKITYSSSNSKIAAVNSKGVITGKKVGTAKIIVKAGSKKVIVTVKVTKIKTTKLTGVPKTKTVNRGKTFTIKAVATPRNTDEKVTYRSSNKKIATVTSKGVVKGIRKGTATITVQSGSKKLTCKVTVK